MIKTVIADYHSMIREGIRLIIEQDNDIKVVGGAGSEKEACDLCEASSPDIVLLGMPMPLCDDTGGTVSLREKFGQSRVVVLETPEQIHGTKAEEKKISDVLMSGADAFVFKNMNAEELILTIKSVAKGLKVIDENVYEFLIRQIQNIVPRQREQSDPAKYELTERELEIIRYIVDGKNYKEIASALYLSIGTVRNAISEILMKMKLKDRLQLAVFAVRNNLV